MIRLRQAASSRSAWLPDRLNHGHQLTAIAPFRYETTASSNTVVYFFMLIWFPVIGLLMSMLGAAPLSLAVSGDEDATLGDRRQAGS